MFLYIYIYIYIYIYKYKVKINRITNIQPKPLENWKILANFDLMTLGLQCNFHNSMES